MPRSLQTTWAKLSLAACARFPQTVKEERSDVCWVADDEEIRVAAEGAAKKAEDAKQMEGTRVAGSRPRRRHPTRCRGGGGSVADAVEEEADDVHHRERAKLNAVIEARLAKLTHEGREHEASVRAGRRRLGDLIGRKNELIAQEATRCLL
ncbi:hypothetical protein QYE76_053107 [Lolium multiflorum]|uniref:Uncharacterized protein n=1 Tax=Lolium multiflorum TaxID=4521 RepID=A0AAD8SV06_LOLMU|nr:hypothetical protein QYE76_053107 [Lolium multiflorum]